MYVCALQQQALPNCKQELFYSIHMYADEVQIEHNYFITWWYACTCL